EHHVELEQQVARLYNPPRGGLEWTIGLPRLDALAQEKIVRVADALEELHLRAGERGDVILRLTLGLAGFGIEAGRGDGDVAIAGFHGLVDGDPRIHRLAVDLLDQRIPRHARPKRRAVGKNI